MQKVNKYKKVICRLFGTFYRVITSKEQYGHLSMKNWVWKQTKKSLQRREEKILYDPTLVQIKIRYNIYNNPSLTIYLTKIILSSVLRKTYTGPKFFETAEIY